MKRRTGFNPKRRIRNCCDNTALAWLLKSVGYSGNPEHKRNPGDFGLPLPSQPRPDKTLCDAAGITAKHEAMDLLKNGIQKGLVSEQQRNGFPQNIWAVTDEGCPMEAQLENEQSGIYHGYPMPITDPFREEVLARWNNSK
jgi:hypothetical protein